MTLKSTLLLLLAVLLVRPTPVSASTIISQPWQPIVNYADLVGVIECVTAGEIVARYRVVESWKGPEEGTVLTVEGATSTFMPSPIVLCGERLLVAAWKYRRDYPLAARSEGSRGSLPAFWRDEHPDYFVPSVLNYRPLRPNSPENEFEGVRMIGGHPGDLNSFRRDVKALLALPDEAREAAVLRALIDWHIGHNRSGSIIAFDSNQVMELVARANTSSVDSIIIAVNDFVEHGSRDSGTAAFDVLSMGGGSHTLASLSMLSAKQGGWTASQLSALNHIIRWRLGLAPLDANNPIAIPGRPTSASLDSMRALLEIPAQTRSEDYGLAQQSQKAFETLAVYDPAFLASYLAEWSPEPWNVTEGYGLGSFFGWRCGRDRATHMRRLLKAKDPYVRVAGAIYLSFEDESEGVRALQKLMDLPGDPGAWAALNLARRGDKTGAARALDSFLQIPKPTAPGQIHRDLQKRLLVLFSNSADGSHVPQPPPWRSVRDQDDQSAVYETLARWWKENEARLVLRDPWFEDWKRQKIE